MSKTIMIYYSLGGNTKFVAEKIKEKVDIELEELKPQKEPPKKGIGKFLVGGRSVIFKENVKLLPIEHDINNYENVIIAFPI